MANIQFQLNRGVDPNKLDPKKKYSIYIRYSDGRNVDYKAALKNVKLLPKEWNSSKMRVSNSPSTFKFRTEINKEIVKVEDHFLEFENSFTNSKQKPTRAEFKFHLHLYYNPDAKSNRLQKKLSLFEYFEFYIENEEKIGDRTKGTMGEYLKTKNILEKFYNTYPFDFSTINMTWYTKFVKWCRKEKSLKTNTIGKHIKNLKALMRDAQFEGQHNNTEYLNPRFRTLRESVFNIALNQSDIDKLFLINLESKPEHKKARDLFLVACETGLRVADFNSLKKHNFIEIDDKIYLNKVALKTNKPTEVVLSTMARNIVERYNLNLPEMPPQKLNERIKEVCEWAGVDDIVYEEKKENGVIITNKYYKYELVTNHTARRTFCTNAYLNNVNHLEIMRVSGHSSVKTLLEYIKGTTKEKAQKSKDHEFFNRPLPMRVA
jgi:integrase